MRRCYRCSFILLLPLIATSPAIGQKKLQVKMPHPAILGEGIAGARVILGQVTGRCAKEFSSLLGQDLLAHGIPLVAQAEPGVTAVVTISIDISECQALPDPPIIGSGLPATHISRTVGHFLATLHAVSYTHLDVYKRQPRCTRCRPPPQSSCRRHRRAACPR